VNYATANGTANGFDLTGVSGTLNFAVGETTKVVRVELLNDGTAENLEHFRFNLNTPVNATLAKATAMVSIVDNDQVVDTPNLFVRDVVVDEQAGTASFVVLLGGPSGQSSNSVVTVDYATGNSTSNATATAGSDYTATSGTLTFAAGETVKTVVVDLTNDAVAEGLERFNLNLSNASGATILDGQGVAVIGANDAVAVAQPRISVSDMVASEADGYVDIVVNLSAPGQNAVAVNYATANGTANGFDLTGVSGTLNFAVGETTKVVRVELLNDGTVEPLETFRFNLSGAVNASLANTFATITIVDNDTAGINVYSYGISDDVYTVTASTDVIVENPGGGNDLVNASVNYTLGANVENLTLTGAAAINGTGNTLNNVLTGNSAANVLTGGLGNDTYVVGAGDTVVENPVGGTDTVKSALTYTLALDPNVENLTLTGAAAINGTGNTLNNVLTGNSAANVLTGGLGNDTYVVGAGDTVVENPSEGTDTVKSALTYTLALNPNVENLTLTGAAAINGTGNTRNNVLTGNSAANVLTGDTGNDTLAGGLGNDVLNGGAGNDLYLVNRGDGQETIQDADATVGNADRLLYGTTINPVDLVLDRVVNDLRIALHGGTEQVTIQNWYTSPTTNQVETIQAGNGKTLLSTQVDVLIQAMAQFTTDSGLSWDAASGGAGDPGQQLQFQSILAASWQ